ncbi:MAG: aminopeptidase N [Chiayiivirga sp.]|jgi:aminopeptidase N|uniref:Aminopeptidase N n=1 Tax=Denitratimonas tolerans TaxID=1338420 RepID=A0AAW9R1X1_9GAMM|nr:aminopeptidase N [Chiayiivirga sp.]MEB2314575.1 aminopeptidase N [Xanthomonadaceae bacterium]HRO86952.1 aminopeptidase N [Chiayiivirga sp.]
MTTDSDTVVRLADYRAPAWRITHVALEFELGATSTRVTSTLRLVAQPGQPAPPLRLDGEDLELLDIALDGRTLGPGEYTLDASGLTLTAAPSACELRTTARIHPQRNTRLEGLYLSRGALFTQCEAEGFRRITWFIDRPDVSAVYDVTLIADRARFPVLLSNGDRVAAGELDGGRHFARWHDPHPKPSYLFALVAGDLARLSAPFTTMQGRTVEVNVWADRADVARCEYALGAVLRAMQWDERRFGRAYDLAVFNVVAAQDFTMGAMENKGLNIFNARYILADADTATDDDFIAIESVIGHEYFHNWSGNRVTLRDWFQLSLKEGLTVFRDQEFTADLHSRGLKRIEDARLLRSRQFVEDAGPLSHPVRPPSYREINNFYTATVYEKGAELVRMLHTLLGETGFRRGLDLYFERHDGGAATVEDLVAAMDESSGRDLTQFLHWWEQPGTPRIEAQARFDAVSGEYTLTLRQHGSDPDHPLHIPLALAFYDANGRRIDTHPEVDADYRPGLIELRQREHTLRLRGLTQPPLPAFLQGLSAPVRLDFDYAPEQLARLVQVETDPLTRWQALQQLARTAILPGAQRRVALDALLRAQSILLDDPRADAAFVAACLALPDFWDLGAQLERIDVDALWAAREATLDALAIDQTERLRERHLQLTARAAGGLEGDSASARRLRNLCLARLARVEREGERAVAQYHGANTLTDRLAALQTLLHAGFAQADEVLQDFAARHRGDALVVDRWLGALVTAPRAGTLDTVATIVRGPFWQPTNPNRVRAVLGSFVRSNVPAFHRADGAGYALFFELLPALDSINPQVASRHLALLENWRRLDDGRRRLLDAHFDALQTRLTSRDSRETLARLRGADPD